MVNIVHALFSLSAVDTAKCVFFRVTAGRFFIGRDIVTRSCDYARDKLMTNTFTSLL